MSSPDRWFLVIHMGRSVDIREVPARTSRTLTRPEAWSLALKKANGIRFITFTGLDGDTQVIWEPEE